MNKEQQEEVKWFKSVKTKLQKYISSPYWDDINLSSDYIGIITTIMNTKNVKDLPLLINERLTDTILDQIKTKINKAKQNSKDM